MEDTRTVILVLGVSLVVILFLVVIHFEKTSFVKEALDFDNFIKKRDFHGTNATNYHMPQLIKRPMLESKSRF